MLTLTAVLETQETPVAQQQVALKSRERGAGTAAFPEKLAPLFRAARYKVFYGGRGGGKSWGVATYLLAQAAERPMRILCCREFQSSMRESVHKLLVDTIRAHGLDDKFEVMEKSIRHICGSEFIFEGLHHNVGRIRSLEGVDKVWVEEAQTVSNASWEILIPTIRKEGSEIIVTFNPELESDATYQRFVIHPPPDAVVVKINYADNPWFPPVLQREMLTLKERDADAYAHIWLGECRHTLEGAIYANELRAAAEQGRITRVGYDPTKGVNVYFDLGWSDQTSVWFTQHVAQEIRLIDFHQDAQKPFAHYMEVLRERHYQYHTVWLPHDARARSLGTGRSIEELARAAGWRVRIVPNLSVSDGINAVRTVFPSMWFDEGRCSDGIQSLRYYRYEVDGDTGQFSRRPAHDQASHAADALRYVAVAMQGHRQVLYEEKRAAPPRLLFEGRVSVGTGWMRA